MSLQREKLIVKWLEFIAPSAKAIYLVGDVFDFWFEYKKAAPRGYTRLLGTLAKLADSGIEIHYFTGNHDMWIFDYLPNEIGFKLYREPISVQLGNKLFYIGHGDGLGPGDHGYKFLKKVFANKLCQRLFGLLHPSVGIGLADFFSSKSRMANVEQDEIYLGKEKEWLAIYAEEQLSSKHHDYFVFGHRHLPINLLLSNQISRYINLGEWIKYNSYARFDGENLELLFFESQNEVVYGNAE